MKKHKHEKVLTRDGYECRYCFTSWDVILRERRKRRKQHDKAALAKPLDDSNDVAGPAPDDLAKGRDE